MALAKKGDVLCGGGREGLFLCPSFEAGDIDEAGVDAVGEVIEGVSGVVCPVHDLAFDAAEAVAFTARV
jgi:hypothetical protein